MSITKKPSAPIDSQQTLKYAYNKEDASITTNGFLVGKVGRKVELVISTTNVANDTETYTFIEDAVTLYQLEIIYTDGTRETMLSAERIA